MVGPEREIGARIVVHEGEPVRIEVGGVNVASIVSDVTVHLAAQQRSYAVLTVPLVLLSVDDVRADLDASTTTALKKLGYVRG